MAPKTTIALIYDFDKTLCTRDMQEYGFIPNIGVKAKDFWKRSAELTAELGMDSILAYMYTMVRSAQAARKAIRRENFVELGASIEFFPGVPDWFARMNAFAKEQNVTLEHYIISSGLSEIIEGSAIYGEFKKVFACEFHYDENGVADWPLMAVNYTTKTQFLFRINKGELDPSDNTTLNKYVEEDQRAIPFRNMIYFGDGLTDVPCMKLVRVHGGKSIAVFPKGVRREGKAKVENLLLEKRVDFIECANYQKGSSLEKLVQEIIVQMALTDRLIKRHSKQYDEISSGGPASRRSS